MMNRLTIAILTLVTAGLVGCSDDDGTRTDAYFSAVTGFLDAVCECEAPAGQAECKMFPVERSYMECVFGVIETAGHGDTIDCIIRFAQQQTTCVSNANCDDALLEQCQGEPACEELPSSLEEQAEQECGWLCDNGNVLDAELECNDVDDCRDGSDEFDCISLPSAR